MVALTGVAQLGGYHPAKQRVASWIPGQTHAWVAGLVPGWGTCRGQLTDVSLPLSLPPSLKVNK